MNRWLNGGMKIGTEWSNFRLNGIPANNFAKILLGDPGTISKPHGEGAC